MARKGFQIFINDYKESLKFQVCYKNEIIKYLLDEKY